MCRHLQTYLLLMVGASIFGTFVIYTGNFYTYYLKRSKEWQKAKTYIESNTCSDPFLYSKLADWNLCDKSEETVSRLPFMAALYDIGDDLHICGNNRCVIFYTDFTGNLHKIVIALGLVGIGFFYVARKNYQYNNHHREYYQYTLPNVARLAG